MDNYRANVGLYAYCLLSSLDPQQIQQLKEECHVNQLRIRAQEITITAMEVEIEALDSRVKAKDNEIKVAMKVKDNNISVRDSIIKAKEGEIKLKEDEIKTKENQIKLKDSIIKMMDSKIKTEDREMEAMHDEIEMKEGMLKARDNEIMMKNDLIAHLQQKVDQYESQEHYKWTGNQSWNIPRAQMKSIAKHEIGHGAWGVVYSGTFQGQRVAIKHAHREVLHPRTIEMLKREVMIMAEIQHPNLVRFIAAVFDDAVDRGTDTPIVVSELMEMNLREAYRKVDLSSNLISIFCDVACALHYLHHHHQPIIHRDISAPNVLLETLRNGTYQAKVSDFGSANLVKQARTAATGSIIYCAPEMFPSEDITVRPKPQTTKVDVFSYGILMLEVIVKEMPTHETRYTMLQQVRNRWILMHELIVHCTKPSPSERPAMADILNKLNRLPH